ncbi:MAG TPA: NAD(P)/FAD-dependent oxidoreductase [Flavobacteriaceae bacterium]|nr:NAD(P)/FAD-dependent oxidoreductase [Flavobacteriaceae bacterium]
MTDNKNFDVIIIGGSYSGLSAGLVLGRALRHVLIIDSGRPCNIQTPHSHNFITQDGKTPKEIATAARLQIENYKTVKFYSGLATSGKKIDSGFEIKTESGDCFTGKKLIFATGLKDIMPDIEGFAECWGISVIHCAFCLGYESKNKKAGIIGNGDYAFKISKLTNNWTKDITLFTNGKSTLTEEQLKAIAKHNISVVETEIDRFEHTKGNVETIVFNDGSKTPVKAIYTKAPFVQHCDIPKQLGCEFTELDLIKVDEFQKTTVLGIWACGDNASTMRSVSNAVAKGTLSAVMATEDLIDEEF